ncbi:MAG TPA: lambda exonuclease family protein [Allocoleopsis sp.]
MDKKVLKLLKSKQYKQKSDDWYSERKNLITASSAANVLKKDDKTCDSYINTYDLHDTFDKNGKCCNPYSSKEQYIAEKCKQQTSFKGNMATYWGQKYEPVALSLYSKTTGKEILDFGLIKHDSIKWLGASPDGITKDGVMVEIKCPFRRKITGIPPFYYWIQVQIQLEVCDLEYCDFAEYEFMEFDSEEEFFDNTKKGLYSGVFIKIESSNSIDDPSELLYVYPDSEFRDYTTKQMIEWKNRFIEEKTNDSTCLSPVYWKVIDMSVVRIKRDREWFNNIFKDLEEAYYTILDYRKNGIPTSIKKPKTCIF